jgi:FkbM family methyltransferase
LKFFVKLFIRFHYFLNSFGITIKGLGKAQKFLIKSFIFKFNGIDFFYDPGIEGSYDYLLIDKPNEPETHVFLNRVFDVLEEVSFIDVGASVGEFAFGLSAHKNIKDIYAFEPRPECAEVLRKNASLNRENRIKIIENALDDLGDGSITLHHNPGGSSSGIYSQSDNPNHIKVNTLTLDKALPAEMQNPVLLIDVEGAEPLVIKGGINFITRNKPLIIFEYNNTSKQHYNISQIAGILGPDYDIYRLNHTGMIDKDLIKTWNCVAVPCNSLFSKILTSN